MRPLDDKECYSYSSNGVRPVRKTHQQAPRAKPLPSKWDDAQKWLVGRRGADSGVHVKHRNSNADDRRLLSSTSQNGRLSCSSVDGALAYSMVTAPSPPPPLGEGDDAGETKRIDCMHGSPVAVIQSVCLRDMGTEMTPIASKEPSRTSTPLRRRPEGSVGVTTATALGATELVAAPAVAEVSCGSDEGSAAAVSRAPNATALESRAAAWDEAERAKFTARCGCLSP